MSPFDPRLTLIAAQARVKTCHVFHCWKALQAMGKQFHAAAFAEFAGLQEHHVEAILEALERHSALPDKRAATDHRGSRLPADFTAPEDWISWAVNERKWEPSVARAEAEIFADFWHAKTGQGATKLDWRKTWQNWVRNSSRPNGDYRPVEQRQTPEQWVAYCESMLRRAKDADWRKGIEDWTEKLAEARVRAGSQSNVLPFSRTDSDFRSSTALYGG